ncbi:flagellar assembly protein T N-terminal domain-containing protein [Paraglaciecola sp. Hal342]
MWIFLPLFAVSLFSQPALAVWYQGNAQLAVDGADLNVIRAAAIKNAIADASFQHGIMITAKDISLDGLLQSSKTELRSEGKIRRVEILSEEVVDDILHVYVKVDIEPLFDCSHDNYMRALLVTQLPVLKPAQASYGAIFDLGPQVSKRVEQQLFSDELVAKVQLINQVFIPKSVLQEPTFGYISDTARHLANQYHSQFVLFGYIRDISLFEQTTKGLISDDVALGAISPCSCICLMPSKTKCWLIKVIMAKPTGILMPPTPSIPITAYSGVATTAASF